MLDDEVLDDEGVDDVPLDELPPSDEDELPPPPSDDEGDDEGESVPLEAPLAVDDRLEPDRLSVL